MSEYVKIKRRLYDELIETKAKYVTLCQMIEALKKVYEQNKFDEEITNYSATESMRDWM